MFPFAFAIMLASNPIALEELDSDEIEIAALEDEMDDLEELAFDTSLLDDIDAEILESESEE